MRAFRPFSFSSHRPSDCFDFRCRGRAMWRPFAPILCGLSIFGCGEETSDEAGLLKEASKAEVESAAFPANRIEHGTFRYSERGLAVHMLEAAVLERFSEEGSKNQAPVVVSGGFTLYLDGDEHKWAAKLQAQRGTFDEATLRLTALGDVVLENQEGDRLETEELVWANDSDRVWTRRPVTITTEDGVIQGSGLESDGRFEDYVILDPTGAIEIDMPE